MADSDASSLYATGGDTESGMQGVHTKESEDGFRTVMSSRNVRRKKRKIREGSISVENLALRADWSSDNDMESQHTQDAVFRTRTSSSQAPDPDFKIFITPIDREKSLKNISMVTIAKSIQNCIGSEPEFIKTTRNGILVKCFNAKQHKKLTEIQNIGNVPVNVKNKLNLKKGVISGIPTNMTEKEIETELKRQKVVNAKRIVRKNKKREESQENAVPTPTRSVILSFETTELPTDIILCFQKINVKPYIPPILRCFKCQRYGHTITACKQRQRCVRCGEEHNFDDCTKKDSPKCVNCGGEHSAAFNGCEAAKKALEIQKIKVQNNLSYAQAVRKLNEGRENLQAQQAPKPAEHNPVPVPPHTQAMTSNEPQSSVKQNFFTLQTDPSQPIQDPPPQPASPLPQRQNKQASEKIRRPSPPLKENFITSATNEELITFFLHLMIHFMKDKSEAEVLSLIKTAAGQLLTEKQTPAS